ncbi:MAG: hypothetical protein JXB07_08325 [Anaerolineae bacterium]|nr:hypothetical protein [Anaerolineae bacterium]
MVAEELGKVLSGQRPVTAAGNLSTEENQVDVEAKYGAKLDKMLGGLSKPQYGLGGDE